MSVLDVTVAPLPHASTAREQLHLREEFVSRRTPCKHSFFCVQSCGCSERIPVVELVRRLSVKRPFLESNHIHNIYIFPADRT